MVGLPGSGKTTEAIRLEKKYHALRLTPDEWHYRLFGNDFHNDDSVDAEHDRRHTTIEQIMQDTAERVLEMGGDVILDFGCWARVERDELRARAAALGADFKIHYMECSKEELWERLQARNRLAASCPFSASPWRALTSGTAYSSRRKKMNWNPNPPCGQRRRLTCK